jgi:hypothetical protein
MSEEEIKAALSIEVRECGNMCSDWIEIDLMWNDEVISTSRFNEVSHDG